MNVLHILSEKSWRGGEQQAAYLIQYCQQQGINNHVICRINSAFENYCKQYNLIYLSAPFISQYDFYTAWQIKNYCKRNVIDLVHLHSANAHGLAILAVLLGNKTSMILSRRVIFPIKQNWFSRYKYNHSYIKKIICVSDAVKEIIRREINDKNKCITIYDGINLSKFSRTHNSYLRAHYNLSNSTILIGNIAALSADKGLFTFIDSAKILINEGLNAKFFIIGTGELQGNLQNYISQHQLNHSVFLTGFLSDMPHIIPELDIVVMSSEKEGLGSSLLDAMACGTPVIATATGGIPEIVIHEQTGLLAPVGDATAIANQIKKILDNPSLKQRLIHNAFQHLQNHFTIEKMGENTLKVYQEIISKQLSQTIGSG